MEWNGVTVDNGRRQLIFILWWKVFNENRSRCMYRCLLINANVQVNVMIISHLSLFFYIMLI